MSISPYNPNERYRQRATRRMTNFIAIVLLLSAILGIGIWLGGIKSQQEIYILEGNQNAINLEREQMQEDVTRLRAQAQTAGVRLEQLKASYDELLGSGPLKDIVTLLKKQIDQGVDIDRLRSVIQSVRPPQNCSETEFKRFVIVTPVYSGPSSVATIQNGISVQGTGVASQNAQGQKEAWFDPNQPVELTFSDKNGVSEVKSGVLPLYYSMVVEDKEYRFNITVGAKSFAKVTYDNCDYP